MAVPLIAMVLGAGINAYNQNQAAQAAIAGTEKGIGDQTAYQKQITDALGSLIGNMKGDSPSSAEATARGDYLGALNSASGNTGAGEDINGGGQYSTDAAQEAVSQHHNAMNLADMLAKVQAPTTERRMQGYKIDDAGQSVGKLANFARGQAGVDQLVVGGAHTDPYLSMLGNALQMYGSSQGGKAAPSKSS